MVRSLSAAMVLGLLVTFPSWGRAQEGSAGVCCTPATVTWVPVRTLRPVVAAPVTVCRPVVCCPASPPQTYAPQQGGAPGTVYRPASPAPQVVYQPVMVAGPRYVLGRGILGQPKLYVDGQPVRNFLRWLTP